MDSGVIHSWSRPGLIGNQRSSVVASSRNQRPAVVVPRKKDVHFIAAHGADLRLPQLSCFNIEGESVSIPVTVGKNLGLCSRAPHKRIVRRHSTVIAKPKG